MNSAFRTPHSAFIRVLLIDDSPIALKILERILSSAPDIKVLGTAKNGKEGLDLIAAHDPDVVCTDLHMPVMDGLEFVKEVMARYPRPILVISVSVQEGSQNIFKLLEAGAVDVFAKPRSGIESEYDKRSLELISKIRMLSGVKVFRRPSVPNAELGMRNAELKKQLNAELGMRNAELKPEANVQKIEPRVRMPEARIERPKFKSTDSELRIPHSALRIPGSALSIPHSAFKIVAIGASTGGPQTLEAILSRLPANYPLPIICVQHIGDEFLDGFIEWLASLCRMKVRIARTGDLPETGTIYFPHAGTHLKIGSGGKFVYTTDPPYDGHRPSITVMFRSLADFYKNRVMSILLTGMGRDGAEGMQAVSKASGVTIAQDRESSIVFGMPKAAIELGAAKYVLRPEEIAETLLELGKN